MLIGESGSGGSGIYKLEDYPVPPVASQFLPGILSLIRTGGERNAEQRFVE
jgi:hypothetical protein